MTYVFRAPVEAERRRLAGIEGAADLGTCRLLDDHGVAAGMRCLEAGAGAGSVARWLADRVGPSGHVLAIDLEPAMVDTGDRTNLEVQRRDVVRDPLPRAAFDLVYARLLLAHLAGWEAALANMVAALRPGGLLLVEDYDWVSWVPDPGNDPAANRLFLRVEGVLQESMLRRGYDMLAGRALARRVAAAGLVDVGGAGRTHPDRGGSAHMIAHRLSRQHLRDPLVAGGAVTAAELDTELALFDDPDFHVLCPTMMAAWGRAPS